MAQQDPLQTPVDLEKVTDEFEKFLKKELKKTLKKVDPTAMSPEEFDSFMRSVLSRIMDDPQAQAALEALPTFDAVSVLADVQEKLLGKFSEGPDKLKAQGDVFNKAFTDTLSGLRQQLRERDIVRQAQNTFVALRPELLSLTPKGT